MSMCPQYGWKSQIWNWGDKYTCDFINGGVKDCKWYEIVVKKVIWSFQADFDFKSHALMKQTMIYHLPCSNIFNTNDFVYHLKKVSSRVKVTKITDTNWSKIDVP